MWRRAALLLCMAAAAVRGGGGSSSGSGGSSSDSSSNDDDCASRSSSLRVLAALQMTATFGNQSCGDDNVVEFRLWNAAAGFNAECSAHGAGLDGSDADKWYFCFVETRDPRVAAAFRYDGPQKRLTVRETWACDADAGNGTAVFEAHGDRVLPLTCSDAVYDDVLQHQCAQRDGKEETTGMEITVAVTAAAARRWDTSTHSRTQKQRYDEEKTHSPARRTCVAG